MRILFDQNMPWTLARYLINHRVISAEKMGWSTLQNGILLQTAEDAGFDIFVTADQSIRYQQNLLNRRIALVVLTRTNWPAVEPHVAAILRAIDAATPGTYQTVRCGAHPNSE